MRESRTYGFVRGAHSNMRPHRDPYLASTASWCSSRWYGQSMIAIASTSIR